MCMHQLFFLIAFIFISNIYGQNISKHYVSSSQDGGILYFAFPQRGFNSIKEKNKLIYDITHHTADSFATLNFSYYDKSSIEIDSVTCKW